MKAIGGYFELPEYEKGVFPHQHGILLNTGRNALEYILRSIGDVKRVFLPYYTCEVILEPLRKLQIPWTYYHINACFEIDEDLQPGEREYIIANNFFGVKDAYIHHLARKYSDHVIVDCAQAFFARPLPGIKSFYSIRKFVGAADGGVAYLGGIPNRSVLISETECTSDHDSHLYIRKEFGAEAGFADYQANEIKLVCQPIRWISDTTKRIIDHIDYDKVVSRRRGNYRFLHESLAKENFLNLPGMNSFACPMVYPFVARIGRDLRNELVDNKVFVAKYWPNVIQSGQYAFECEMAERIVPLPIDQRYGEEEMDRIIEIVKG